MGINQAEALPGPDILQHHIQEHCGLASAGLADDVLMKEPVWLADTESNLRLAAELTTKSACVI